MAHPNEPTIPQEVLAKIGEHRPHMKQLIANIPVAPAQCEKAIADAYLLGEVRLSGMETWNLAQLCRGAGYGDRNMGRPPIDDETRADTFRWRLTPTERRRLDEMAAEHGQTPSQYLRSVVFGPQLQYSAWMDYGTGPILLGTARDSRHAEAMAKNALSPNAAWVSWVVDHGTEHVPGKGEIARFAAHADAPGYNRVVEIDK